MRVQIVIPGINLWNKYSKPCIDSIKTKHEYRILFVDNASTDETLVEAGKLVSDTFSHKRNEMIWCCSKVWNYGINDAFERGFDYVLVLNNDVLLHPDAIDRMVDRFIQAQENQVKMGTQNVFKDHVENKDTKDNDWIRESEILGMVTCMDIRGECHVPSEIFDKKSEDYEKVPEAEHPNFSGFMINKLCWQKVGAFDEKFVPCYFEDNDYHYRIKLAGLKAITLPTALFYHFGSATQNEALEEPICPGPVFERNRDYFKEKWGGLPGDELFDKPFNK